MILKIRRMVALGVAGVIATSLFVIPPVSAATCTVHQSKKGVRWIYRNGQRVNADSTMSLAKQKSILAASCSALATINTISFRGLPKVRAQYNSDGGRWGFTTADGYFVLAINDNRRVVVLRHEFFHHYLEAGPASEDQVVTVTEKDALFNLSQQVGPNGQQTYFNTRTIPRYWPNEDRYSPDAEQWFGGEYAKQSGENFAYLLESMFDGEGDGVWNSPGWSNTTFAGRKAWVKSEVQRILGFSGYNS